jgi:hypothetical protein
MKPELQNFCKVVYFQREHTGHGEGALLPQHRRQRTLSDKAVAFVAGAIALQNNSALIISANHKRVAEEWLSLPDSSREGLVCYDKWFYLRCL